MTKEERLNILCNNLSVFGSRKQGADEERELTLRHIVFEICEGGELSLEDTAALYKRLVPDLEGHEEIILYQQLWSEGKRHSEMKLTFPIGSLEGTPAGSHGKIACVKNSYNNMALEYFSQKINSARPLFLPSFSAVCESVSLGECEFCILPIENMNEGKMLGFYSMIDRYELKICRVFDIEDDHGDVVRYALLSKSCPEPSERSLGTDYIFEFSVLAENGSFVKKLLSATESCGGMLLNFNCSPVQYDSGLRRYLFLIKLSGKSAMPLRCYLSLNYDYYTPIGLYPDIN